jgi:hypothetical protein
MNARDEARALADELNRCIDACDQFAAWNFMEKSEKVIRALLDEPAPADEERRARIWSAVDELRSIDPEPVAADERKARRKAVRKAVEREMRARTYDRHAYDEDVFMEGVRDIARAALEAAEAAR